ncbi:hypothetical protein PPN31114_04370 [Pandoraea pneumonica]|jgi:hypothetical protein|uniref:Uncharacterized protein n=1 Tax=Pandoraea pneumonica TaxID=2508299 RepID=A0A5E4YAA3_9BURK|nr:hypothetical protein [Pandoraea pneumonica]VVE45143.1 hypothetical protein PPN31114_04370 [Pandoraea pneumonica]
MQPISANTAYFSLATDALPENTTIGREHTPFPLWNHIAHSFLGDKQEAAKAALRDVIDADYGTKQFTALGQLAECLKPDYAAAIQMFCTGNAVPELRIGGHIIECRHDWTIGAPSMPRISTEAAARLLVAITYDGLPILYAPNAAPTLVEKPVLRSLFDAIGLDWNRDIPAHVEQLAAHGAVYSELPSVLGQTAENLSRLMAFRDADAAGAPVPDGAQQLAEFKLNLTAREFRASLDAVYGIA